MPIPDDVQERITKHWGEIPPDVQERLQRAGAAPSITRTPTTTHDIMPNVLRAVPATAGALQLGAMAAPLGAPLGPLGMAATGALGAGIGAGLGEGGLAAGQRMLGLPQGRPPIFPRMLGAGQQGMLADIGGRALGAIGGPLLSRLGGVGQRIESALGRTRPFGIPFGAGERMAAGLAGTRGASAVVNRVARAQSDAITKAGYDIVEQAGLKRETANWLRQATRSIRMASRAKSVSMPEMEALVQQLGLPAGTDITALMRSSVKMADVAEHLAKVPGGMEALGQRVGRKVSDQMAREWWTANLAAATGQSGLRKGMVDPDVIISAWDKLGQMRQQRLFQNLAPQMGRFVDALREVHVAGAAKEGKAIPWLSILGGVEGVLRMGRQGGAVGAGLGLAGPFLAAQALTSPGGAELLARTLGSAGMQTAAEAAPGLIRGATQLGAQMAQPTLESQAGAAIIPQSRDTALALREAKRDPAVHDIIQAAHRRPEAVTLGTRPMEEAVGDFFPITRRILLDPQRGLDPTTIGHELTHFLATVVRSPYQRSEALAEFSGAGGDPAKILPASVQWTKLSGEQQQAVRDELTRILRMLPTEKGPPRFRRADVETVRGIQQGGEEGR